MDSVGFLRIDSPFPFASAIVATNSDRAGTLGDCFVFVQNRRNFIGYQRIKMPPGISSNDVQARMRQVVQRVHDKMGGAARRKGLLPQSEAPLAGLGIAEESPELVSNLWRDRGFAEILDWVGKTTASALLRAEIEKCRLRGSDEPGH